MTQTTPTIEPDALTMDSIRDGLLRDRPVAVLGFARSGIALARFLGDAGARVSIYDGRPANELGRAIEALGGRSVTLALGPEVDPSSVLDGAALVATSPAINPDYPTTEPRLRAALRSMVDRRAGGDLTAPALLAEADLFLRLCPAPTIGVTGTKGKTTTSSLIATVLAADPAHPVVLGGNIGIPLVERLWELTPDQRVVIELSELQLPTLSRGTTVAVYTNVTSDHLDRHGSLEAYRAVKRRLVELVDPTGAVVLNADDPIVASYADGSPVPLIRYGIAPSGPVDVGVDGDWIVAGGMRVMPVADIRLPGRHNWSNVLAAVAVGWHFGVGAAAMRAAVAAFPGVEHRLEAVATIDGVRFVNDSQGTQPDAVIAALRAFDAPVVLIAGGRDKDVDLTGLAPVVAEHAHAAVLIGESGPALERLFQDAGLARTERAGTLDDAVTRADAIAREALRDGAGAPATVLLSPAAASFDMFEDYAARGRAFKAAVARLRETRERAATEEEGSR
jgi:UDP-N-acetylmuramoylalanine--D-glutamate ligase